MSIYQVDAFTDKPFFGNPTAVVLDADEFTPELKQFLASEMNLPITAFVLKSKKADFKIEYYTPKKEIEIGGHATIAVFWLLAEIGKIKPDNDYAKVTQETKLGILPVEIFWKKGILDKVLMTQLKPTFTEVDLSIQKLADILGIRPDKIECNDQLPLVVASTGSPKLLVLITSKEMTDAMVPKFDDIERLCRRLKCDGIHLYTFDTYLEGSTCYTRHFEPYRGAPETPISGMANGALGAFLVEKGFAQPGTFYIEQGESVERAGKVEVKIEVNNKKVSSVKIGGKAKIVFKIEFKENI
ncbi:MAG: PhzF family phenazine biosynthesis protein [Candidatus Heimdallarchaeota archaeon]|nr:PhzF family phenazine biosynthesis protein [Candidatus Heimdallarchaeota archaeon]